MTGRGAQFSELVGKVGIGHSLDLMNLEGFSPPSVVLGFCVLLKLSSPSIKSCIYNWWEDEAPTRGVSMVWLLC